MKNSSLKMERIRQERLQWQLAGEIGISNTHLSLIENGRMEPTERVKKACSKILKKPVKDLFPNEQGKKISR